MFKSLIGRKYVIKYYFSNNIIRIDVININKVIWINEGFVIEVEYRFSVYVFVYYFFM